MEGYYRYPNVHKETIVFVCENDLWKSSIKGGEAIRITNTKGENLHPIISPDGKKIVYASSSEGQPEIFTLDLNGGTPHRLTFLGARCLPVGWSPDSNSIYFVSNFESPFEVFPYQISKNGGEPIKLPFGPCTKLSIEKDAIAIGRHAGDPARWKRYKGGTAGEFWLRPNAKAQFKKILDHIKGNVTCPLLIKNRLYFLSDHEGIGNLYSCDYSGKTLKKHTDHKEYYARNATTDREHIVYHAGGDLYKYHIATEKSAKITIRSSTTRETTNRKFIKASHYLQDVALNCTGTHLSITTRGKLFSFANWNGPVIQHGKIDGVRYRQPTWLKDGKSIIAISDEKNGEDRPILFQRGKNAGELFANCVLGRVHNIVANPKQMKVVITNHRNELLLLDTNTKKLKVLDKSNLERIGRPAWSPDGVWVAYPFKDSKTTQIIRIVNTQNGQIENITKAVLSDDEPVFDPDGKYLYFISNREFNPTYDSVLFDLSFHHSQKIYAIVLQKNEKSPFDLPPQAPSGDKDEDKKKPSSKKNKKIKIDFQNITERLVEFPFKSGSYSNLQVTDKKIMFLSESEKSKNDEEQDGLFELRAYDLEKQSGEILSFALDDYELGLSAEDMVVAMGNDIRVVKAGEKITDDDDIRDNLKTGWINLNRVSVSINRVEEWKQMYREAWLLQREHFWNSNMSGINWKVIFDRYWDLIPRISTRSEFSDLIWEMQGELGTSHCYEFGGDYDASPQYQAGKLGCTFHVNKKGEYFFDRIFKGDPTKKEEFSPLRTPGHVVASGDQLIAINDIKIDKSKNPRELLVNQAKHEIQITIKQKGKLGLKKLTVKPLKNDAQLIYRDWVEKNREAVHRLGKNKIGYVHIPDMGVKGYSEFHRYFLAECRFDALIVDVRYNGGGHVSQLILDKLNRKRLGYDLSRWSKIPDPYPLYTIPGPINCITNEYAGSDGDIFSHSFKMLKIGKLIGKRTWGGVIGINGQYDLNDGSVTTQPEFSFWFNDVGWGVENYGTDPDLVIEISPEDYVKDIDRQLLFTIQTTLEQLKKSPVIKPDLSEKPNTNVKKQNRKPFKK